VSAFADAQQIAITTTTTATQAAARIMEMVPTLIDSFPSEMMMPDCGETGM
jgi:hypothetical protein